MARFSRFSRKPRFRRFRRKNRGTWFPAIGSHWLNEDGEYWDTSISGHMSGVDTDRANGPNEYVTPVTKDTTQFGNATGFTIEENPSLRDIVEGNEYILKSIIGNVTVVVTPGGPIAGQAGPTSYWQYLKVAAGFFVARAADDDQTLPDLTAEEIDPGAGVNTQNPWIWRRTWILANPRSVEVFPDGIKTGVDLNLVNQISSNRELSDLTGTFVHTKSRRRIRREQRLWFSATAIGWDGVRSTVSGTDPQSGVDINVDVRIFGTMVKGKNSSAF